MAIILSAAKALTMLLPTFTMLSQLCKLKHYRKTDVGDISSSFNLKPELAMFPVVFYCCYFVNVVLVQAILVVAVSVDVAALTVIFVAFPKLLLLLFGWFGSKV